MSGALSGEARLEAARRAGFYPLLLLLERLQEEPLGSLAAPLEETVRLLHAPDLCFSAADVVSVERKRLPAPADDLAPAREILEVTTSFLGLTGAVSPLPAYLTEELLQDDEGGACARAFLDLFHHRLLSLLYRTLARCDLASGLRGDCADAWSRRLLLLLGFDPEEQPRDDALPPAFALRLAGLLEQGEVSARTLEVALEDALSAELESAGVSVEPFVGAWVAIDPDQLTRLGRAQSRLGRDLLLGSRVFDRAGKFRITVGPLTREGYARFAREAQPPAGAPHPLRRIGQLVRALVPGALEHEVVLWLRSDAAPTFQLAASGPTRLGRNSWLGSQAREARINVSNAA